MKITIANGRIVNLLQLAKALAAYPDGEYTLIVEMVQILRHPLSPKLKSKNKSG